MTDTAGATDTDTIPITVGTPPQVMITAPADGTIVNVGTLIAFSATASDTNEGDLTSRIGWTAVLHHNVHTHPDYLPPTTGGGGSVVLDDHGDDTFLELCAQVTNSADLTARQCVNVRPRTTTVRIDSVPQGRSVSFAGVTSATPFTVQANVDGTRTLSALLTSGCYTFDRWSDVGAATHDIVVADPSPTYTATFIQGSSACEQEVLSLGFDEGSGTVANDASGLGNNAQLLNGAGWGAGRVGGALQLDGVNDIAAVSDSPSLGGFSGALTVAAWVQRSAEQNGWRSAVSRQLTTTADDQFFLVFSGAQPYFGINTTAGGNQSVAAGVVPLGQWAHLAGVYDGVTMKLYVNGVERASLAKTGTIKSSSRPILIGGGANTANALVATETLNGRIDRSAALNFTGSARTRPQVSTVLPSRSCIAISTASR